MLAERLSPSENQTRFHLRDNKMSDEAREFLTTHGFVVHEAVFDANERASLLEAVDAAVAATDGNHPDVTMGVAPDGTPRAGRVYRLAEHVPLVARLVDDPRVQALAELCPGAGRLMTGHRSGVVYQDKWPDPGSGFRGLRWHDDYDTPEYGRTLTVGIYLDRSTQGNGAMRVVPGTHRSGDRSEMPTGTETHADEVAVLAEPGDVTAHLNGLWHCSPAGWLGGDEGRRRVVYFTYSEKETDGLPAESPADYRAQVDL